MVGGSRRLRCCLTCLAVLAAWCGTPVFSQQVKPNVILIIADDMAPYDVNALGNDQLETPNMDMLASGGMVFTNAYNMGGKSGAVCLTSRQMMMSGRMIWSPLGSTDQTFGPAFNNAGYETFLTSKSGNTYTAADLRFSFIGFRGNERSAIGPSFFANSAIDFMQQKIGNGVFDETQTISSLPYLAQIALANPHDRRDAPQEYLDRHGAIAGSNPSGWTQTQLDSLPDLPQNYLGQHPFDNGDLTVRDEVRVEGVGTSREPLIVRNELGKQYAVIEYMDFQIGRVLDQAEAVEDAQAEGGDDGNDVLDNTIVIFTADHGIAVGSHGLMGKQNLYQHCSRVPMIVFGPGIAQGINAEDIYLGDVFPTLLDLTQSGGDGAGTAGSADDTIEYESFAAAARGEVFSGREAIYCSYTGNGATQRSIKVGDWKLIHYSDINRTQLFNLADNPLEIYDQDLAHDVSHFEKVEELRQTLLAEMATLNDPGSLGVHVGINVAFDKPATQSSTFNNNSLFAASNGTDGAGSERSGTTHTASDDATPSWEVDLEGNFAINKIVVHNRLGTTQGRLRDILVEILDEDQNVIFSSELLNPDNVLGGGVFDFQQGPDFLEVDIINFAPTVGTRVRIRRLGSPTNALDGFDYNRVSDQYVLALDEVQVFSSFDGDGDCPGGFGLGDVNRDGTVDFDDISPFITLLSTDRYSCEADIDQNGEVDFSDIGPFIILLSGI